MKQIIKTYVSYIYQADILLSVKVLQCFNFFCLQGEMNYFLINKQNVN